MEENHPIPQDITGFQFKLIGTMTIKQFAYLAGGAILAWFFWILPLPGIIRLPLAILIFSGGAAIAFIPIDGRPMDLMIGNFIKAFLSPTKFIYQKNITTMPPVPVSPKSQEAPKQGQVLQYNPGPVVVSHQSTYQEPVSAKPHAFADQTKKAEPEEDDLLQPKEEKPEAKQDEIDTKERAIEAELAAAKIEEQKIPETSALQHEEAHKKVLELSGELQTVMEQKRILEQQLIELSNKLNAQKQVFTPTQGTMPEPQKPQATKNVRTIPQGAEKSAGLFAPEAANIISGIIKDSRGNPLGNILVEVKDGEGNPVRAFKTNGLGHFASATPLVNGSYTIEFEDPKEEHRFDAVAFNADGNIISPLEVISVDRREELRRELFQN